mgnify:CR=1 FL=1
MSSIPEIVSQLDEFDIKRLIGWKGPVEAAYNTVSSGLYKRGLLNPDWTISEKGEEVVTYLKEQGY